MQRGKSFYLYSIFLLIDSGKTFKEIQKELRISKQNLNYYIRPLKTIKYIEKVGYGTWKTIKKYDEKEIQKNLKKVTKITKIGLSQLQEEKDKREIRGHAFQIKLELPKDYKNWNKREKIFNLIGLHYKPLLVGGIKRGQQAEINKIKVHFYNKSIVVNLEESYLFRTAKESKSYALTDFLKIIKKLERMFNNSPLSQYGKYRFRVTRQHYAIIKNSLAKQYLNENKKLNCYTGKGLWLLIDNSFNLEELETVHPQTADEDNEKVQEVFNNIKKEPIEVIKEMTHSNIKRELTNHDRIIDKSMEVLKGYAEQITLHLKVEKQQLITQKKTQEILDKLLSKM